MGSGRPISLPERRMGVSTGLPAGCKAIVYPGTMAQHNALKFAVVDAMSARGGNLGEVEPKRVFTLAPKADKAEEGDP